MKDRKEVEEGRLLVTGIRSSNVGTGNIRSSLKTDSEKVE